MPASPRHYNKKVKNAQEAHEAIRPAGETFRTPDEAVALTVDLTGVGRKELYARALELKGGG